MAHLTLARVSEDGRHLVLVDEHGEEHTLDVDARLRAALRAPTPRSGQETKMDSTLRPRDIQARIRGGQSAEAVAEAAGTTVEKILPFAGPVLAEREHVATRAQRSSVRRRAGEQAGAVRTLGDAVSAHLRPTGADPGSVEWDAWRREDGRWTLTGAYEAAGRTGLAHFTFDVPGNYVLLDDDDARWLVGEVVDQPAAVAAEPDDLHRARQRRLSAIDPGEEESLGDDAIELVTGADSTDTAAAPAASSEAAEAPAAEAPAARPAARTTVDTADVPLDAFLEDQPGLDESAQAEAAADAAALDRGPADAQAEAEAEAERRPAEPAPEEAPARRPVRKSRGRASVPSWDEIMFGGGKQD